MTPAETEVESFEIIWQKIRTGGGLMIMEFRGHGGVMHFGFFEGKGGLKYGSRPSVGTDIFWNRPICTSFVSKAP